MPSTEDSTDLDVIVPNPTMSDLELSPTTKKVDRAINMVSYVIKPTSAYAKMIPLCKTLYLLLGFGVLYDAAFGGFSFTYCTYSKKIPGWPYVETRTQTSDIEVWTWVVIGVSPVIVISVIVVIIVCCKRDKKNTTSIALPRTYVPPPRRYTDTYYEDFTAHPSAQAALNVMAQRSSNDNSNNIYSYNQDGDHVLSPLRRPPEIQLKNDDFAAHSSVQAALNSIAQTSVNDGSRNISSSH
ncbi:hypothetical protein CHS0354_027837 [Potamilus streckersoni]|uniref:Uncharacterized protein n=1 Tax=Potamilus streckersoni TaxID=2493646 RepID=A0AAE0W620_9BIVA|nr:hypothetical protein CHS0354_027837 [Potamilus streckersoni]